MKCDYLKTADRFHRAAETHTVVRVFLSVITGGESDQILKQCFSEQHLTVFLPRPNIKIIIMPARTPLTSCSCVNVAAADTITITHMCCMMAGNISQNKHGSRSCAVLLLA